MATSPDIDEIRGCCRHRRGVVSAYSPWRAKIASKHAGKLHVRREHVHRGNRLLLSTPSRSTTRLTS